MVHCSPGCVGDPHGLAATKEPLRLEISSASRAKYRIVNWALVAMGLETGRGLRALKI